MLNFYFGEDSFTLLGELEGERSKFLEKYPQGALEELAIGPETTDALLLGRLQEIFGGQTLFSKNKFVVFRDIVNGLNKYPESETYLLKSLAHPGAGLALIFVQVENCDKRLRVFKKLRTLAQTIEFSIPTGRELEKWIAKRLSAEGFVISAEALTEFERKLGPEYTLWQVEQELNKLMLYRFGEKSIGADDVRKVVARNINQNVFDLTNLVAEGRGREAVALLEQMLRASAAADQKTQVIQIVGALASQIRSLLLVKEFSAKSAAAETARVLGWKPGRVWINQKLAEKFSQEKLIQVLLDLCAIDFRLKTSDEPANLLLTLLFQKAAA